MAKNVIVQFEFTAGAYKEFQAIQEELGQESALEIIRFGLRTLQFLLKYKKMGRRFMIANGNARREAIFPFLERGYKAPRRSVRQILRPWNNRR